MEQTRKAHGDLVPHVDNMDDKVLEKNGMLSGIPPHTMLPPEILAKIFVDSFDQQCVIIPSTCKSLVPWCLGQVCSTWRIISRAEPLLWNYLAVRKVLSPCYIDIFSLIDDILVQCGGRGGIKLRFSPSGSEEWGKLLYLVSTHSERLRGLDLVLDDTCFEILLKPISAFRRLESLSISYRDIRSPPAPNIILFYGFSTAQNLRSVTIQFSLYSNATDLSGKVLPWNRLTDLSLLNTSATSALVILSHCPSLVTLALDIRNPGFDIRPSLESVLLNHLKTFAITMIDAQSANRLLSSLRLPSLTHITIHDCHLEKGWLHQSGLMLLLELSSCCVTSFKTRGLAFPAAQLIEIMQAMPSLTEISVTMGEPIMENVLFRIIQEDLVPDLRTFEGWEFTSIHSALAFLNRGRGRTAYGVYREIKHATFWLASKAYSETDRIYFEGLLPELNTHERTVRLKVDDYL